MKSQHTPSKPNRRKWLRDAAIATTSAAVLPSLLTGCTDHREFIVKGGLGSIPPLTPEELVMAAKNLESMQALYTDVFNENVLRTQITYDLLTGNKASKAPPNFVDILIDVFSEIGVGLFETALYGAEVELSFLGPLVAVVAQGIKLWADEEGEKSEKRNSLNTTVGEFLDNYDNTHNAFLRKIRFLKSSDGNYEYLRTKWTDFEFLGKKYGLRELAYSNFPTDKSATSKKYSALYDGATQNFERYIWNTLIAKVAVFHMKPLEQIQTRDTSGSGGAVGHVRNVILKEYKASYIIGRYFSDAIFDYFVFWRCYLTIDGVELSESVANKLFNDDTPGNIINPKGFFPRDYVFKQFRFERLSLISAWADEFRDLGKEAVRHPNPMDDFGATVNNYTFTGGLLEKAIKH